MSTVPLAEASTRLAELIQAAKRGEEVVIEDEDHAQFKLVTLPRARAPRVLGLHAGLVDIGENFNEPLPDDFWFGRQS